MTPNDLVVAPVLAPFIAGVLLLLVRNLQMPVRRHLAMAAVLVQIALAVMLLRAVAGGDILVYRLGDWPAPWGIVLVADRLAAGLVLVTSLLALFAVIHAGDGLDRRGRHFHVLFQMQLFGIAGAFLTGDLFNLFVFFEILLIASYGLLLHGGGPDRVRAGLHYVVLNLVGSTIFLFAAGLIYASLGSLNLADLALRTASVPAENVGLARAGGLLLLVVFALKSALLPLCLWLPSAYAHTSAPVAALFAIMTKVGLYSILRIDTLLFGNATGPLGGLFSPWLLPLGLFTLSFGVMGALAVGHLRRLGAWLVVASAGTLLTAFSLGPAGIAAGLYYLPHGTFVAALFVLVAEGIARRRPAFGDALTPDLDQPSYGWWGGLYFATAIAFAGLPPLAGFIGKLLVLRASADPVVWSVVLGAAFLSILALARAGSIVFFNVRTVEAATPEAAPRPVDMQAEETPDPTHGPREAIAVVGLLVLVLALSAGAGPVHEFARGTAAQLVDPAAYVRAVLGGPP